MQIKKWSARMYLAAVATTLSSALPQVASAHEGDCEDDQAHDTAELRATAQRKVEWQSEAGKQVKDPIAVQLLGFNDFHGQLSAGRLVANRPVGGAAVLASYLKSEQTAFNGASFIVHAGDFVGASPAASALLQDEPSITFLNMLANRWCERDDDHEQDDDQDRGNPNCNVVGALGNHEFDEGVTELMRLIKGGIHPKGPFLDPKYSGASFPYVSANVVHATSGKPILPPYVIRKAGKAKIAFVGAVLKQTPNIVTASGVAGVKFLDEAEAINKYIPQIRKKGVEAIVVLIHQGGTQTSYTGPTRPGGINGVEINSIVSRLDGAVDVVVSGHSHSFSNALLPNLAGGQTLVVQAFSASTAYDDIELKIDPASGDVISKSAAIVTTYADQAPGLTPDSAVAALVSSAEAAVAPLVSQVVGTASVALTRTQSSAGESTLGNLIADAQRAALSTDFAFMNPGGIRADLDAGPATWGELFTIQPFGNSLVKLNLTGAQVRALIEQQWTATTTRFLQISGLSYTWDNALPVGSRVTEVRKNGSAIDPAATYTVTCNNFLAGGGDGFTVFTQGTNNVGGAVDLDALIAYIEGLSQPFTAVLQDRIVRLH